MATQLTFDSALWQQGHLPHIRRTPPHQIASPVGRSGDARALRAVNRARETE